MGSRQSERVGPDCKSGGFGLSRCESYAPHQIWYDNCIIISSDIFLLIIMKQLCIEKNHGKQDTIG